MSLNDLKGITDWLNDGARSASAPTDLMAQTCERLVAAGLPLWRVGVFLRTLHPDIFGRNFIWRPGAEVAVGSVDLTFRNRLNSSTVRCGSSFWRGRKSGAGWLTRTTAAFRFSTTCAPKA
jgi:adenylate cyclase